MPTGDDKLTKEQLDALLRALLADKGKPDQDATGAELDLALEGQIVSLLEKGRKIKAIKLYRNQTGAGLKEAKDFVETLAADYDISPKKAGCAGMFLLMVMISAIIGVGVWVLPG